MLQREMMISCTAANFGVAGSAPILMPAPAPDSQAIAIMPAAATAQVHNGPSLPSWRELK